MNKHRMYYLSFLTAYLFLGVLSYLYVDRDAADFFLNCNFSPFTRLIIYYVSQLALGWVYLTGLPILALITWHLDNKGLMRKLIFLFFCVLLACICTNILKIILGRARPHEFFEYGRYGFYWFQLNAFYWSFPSGHTTTISAFMGGLCCLKPEKTALFISLALLVSITRLFMTAHYPSDLMGAYLIAFLSVYTVNAFYKKRGYTL